MRGFFEGRRPFPTGCLGTNVEKRIIFSFFRRLFKQIVWSAIMVTYYYLICRNCGIPDPSWSEIRHFVSFLNSQLRDCEQSFYCDMQLMRAVLAGPDVLNLEGFRSFVVRFMIQMSRVSWLFKSLLTQLSYRVLLTLNNSDTEFWFITVISRASESYYLFWWLCSSSEYHKELFPFLLGFCYSIFDRREHCILYRGQRRAWTKRDRTAST